VFLAFSGTGVGRRLRRVVAVGAVAVALAPLRTAAPAPQDGRLLYVAHGRQATAAVVRTEGRRELYVDGDPEASTGGSARRTEEWLAVLPVLLHPEPRRFLELGLGSGITLGTALRLPYESLECVEIADSVLAASRFFAPDNGGVSDASPRLRIVRGDARVHLARREAAFDVVVGNTVHPWSLGATGLYSQEYFGRMAAALRPGGLAVQWLPIRIEAESFVSIARTFFASFREGGVWWTGEEVLLVGSLEPLAPPDALRVEAVRRRAPGVFERLDVGPETAHTRRLADAHAARAALGPGPALRDDLPRLELWAVRGRRVRGAEAWEALERIAQQGATPLALWIRARAAEARGDLDASRRLAALAESAGIPDARAARTQERIGAATAALREGRIDEAEAVLRGIPREPGDAPELRFALAVVAHQRGAAEAARAELEQLLGARPDHAEAWNLLGAVRAGAGDWRGAREAFEQALVLDPFYPEAMANAGRAALAAGDAEAARALLARLVAIAAEPEAAVLRGAMAAAGSGTRP
jgi:Flp pilus assembly protein TadD